MNSLVIWVARLAGTAGFLLMVVSVVARLQGMWTIGGFQVGTVLLGSIAAMTFGSLCYVASIAERSQR